MPKRWREPKAKPGELIARWGKVDGVTDICIAANGDGVVAGADKNLLWNVICGPRYGFIPSREGPSFLKELELRGYDLTTLRFSVMKKSD
jgi:hypothetical protein